MPSTIPDGFPYEAPGDVPLHSLTGGPSGTQPILAEVLQQKWTGLVTGTIGDIESRLQVVETAVASIRWREIAKGTMDGGDFTISVPGGYSRLRLTMDGDLDGAGRVNLQVNADDTAGRHRYGLLIWDATGTIDASELAEDNQWNLVDWSTVESNTLVVDIWPTDGSANPAYQAIGHRDSGNATSHRLSISYGRYMQDAVVNSLRVIDAGAGFRGSQNNWWLEGYLA